MAAPERLDLESLERSLIPVHAPDPAGPRVRRRAAVAVVLREGPDGPTLALMRRAERPGDRWAGDVSLPGGFAHPEDASLIATAVRETREELGLDLSGAPVLGRLPTRPGPPWVRWVDFSVTPLVFRYSGPSSLSPDPQEAVSARWIRLADLRDPALQRRFWWSFRPMKRVPVAVPMRLPKVVVGDYDVWGLTLDVLHTLWRAVD